MNFVVGEGGRDRRRYIHIKYTVFINNNLHGLTCNADQKKKCRKFKFAGQIVFTAPSKLFFL